MKGPKKFSMKEKREYLRKASELELQARSIDAKVYFKCRKRNDELDLALDMIIAISGQYDLEDKVMLSREEVAPSIYAPELTYDTISWYFKGDVKGNTVYPGLSDEQSAIIEEIQTNYYVGVEKFVADFAEVLHQHLIVYGKLIDLTMVEEPFIQDDTWGKSILYLKKPGRAEYLRYVVDHIEDTCEGPTDVRRRDHGLGWQGYLEDEGNGANVYIVHSPSKVLTEDVIIKHVIDEFRKTYEQHILPSIVGHFHNVSEPAQTENASPFVRFNLPDRMSDEELTALLNQADISILN